MTGTEVLGGGRRGESITTEVTIIVEVIMIVSMKIVQCDHDVDYLDSIYYGN